MSIRITCSKCGNSRSVNRRLIGRTIRCPNCENLIQVSEPEVAAEIVEEVQDVEIVDPDEEIDDSFVDLAEESTGDLDSEIASDTGVASEDETEDDVQEIAFQKRELPKDDMDMTPMVDVTFLLLIFFMITASFAKEKVFEEPPTLSDKASLRREEIQKAMDGVRIQVDEFNGYTVILPGGEDRQASSKQDLLLALEDARKELATGSNNEALQLKVEAHVDSIHAAVVAALDAGRDKGFTSFSVVTVEEFD